MINLVDIALDAKARDLAQNMAAGYTRGYESELADEILSAIPADAHAEVILWLVHEKISGMVAGLCLLDETDAATYDVIGDAAGRLATAIIAQHADGDTHVLHSLIADEIGERKDGLALLASMDAAALR